MVITHRLTSELRRKLKKPIGTLIRGAFDETMRELKRLIENEKPTTLISVGDAVSKNLVKNHLFPQLSIVDNKVMRRKIPPVALNADREIFVKNPPGTITSEALKAIQEALEINYSVKIVVDGEEDLLTLAAVLHAPENSIVVYGQPREGIVVVKVTLQKKVEVAEILKAMENFEKLNKENSVSNQHYEAVSA